MSARLEPRAYTLRIYTDDATANAGGDYTATAQLDVHGDCAIVTAAVGRLTRADLRALVAELRQRGVRWVLSARAPGRVMPFARQRSAPPFAGWWVTDLDEVLA